MKARRRRVAARDQAVSAFSGILLSLCDSTSAEGAALVDQGGETVDYAGNVDPFDIRVAAAEWSLVLRHLSESRVDQWRQPIELLIRAEYRSFAVLSLSEGYAVVVRLRRRSFRVSRRALSEACRDISREAGLSLPFWYNPAQRWTRVDVQPVAGDPRRPASVWHEGAWTNVVILGRYQAEDLEVSEVGFRARLANGAEVTLVREPLGIWYVEDLH